jgi:hypothetical protein
MESRPHVTNRICDVRGPAQRPVVAEAGLDGDAQARGKWIHVALPRVLARRRRVDRRARRDRTYDAEVLRTLRSIDRTLTDMHIARATNDLDESVRAERDRRSRFESALTDSMALYFAAAAVAFALVAQDLSKSWRQACVALIMGLVIVRAVLLMVADRDNRRRARALVKQMNEQLARFRTDDSESTGRASALTLALMRHGDLRHPHWQVLLRPVARELASLDGVVGIDFDVCSTG